MGGSAHGRTAEWQQSQGLGECDGDVAAQVSSGNELWVIGG